MFKLFDYPLCLVNPITVISSSFVTFLVIVCIRVDIVEFSIDALKVKTKDVDFQMAIGRGKPKSSWT
jgi:hypothetical protein